MMKSHLHFLIPAALLGAPAFTLADHPTISLDDGNAGPVTTASAIPLPKGTLSTGVQSQFIFNDEISDADLERFSVLGEDVHSTDSLISLSLNGAYGVTDDLTFGMSLPYIWRGNLREAGHHDDGSSSASGGHGHNERSSSGADTHGADGSEGGEAGSVERLGDSEGIGDLTLHGQYRFLHDEARDRHAALLFGLKTPTGRTGVHTSGGEVFEAEHQPGSGSWDPLVGLAFTQHWGRWAFDTNALYTFSTEGVQDTDLGDIVNYNVALSYRVTGAHDHHGHDHAEAAGHAHGPAWDLILEANGDWRDKVEAGGVADDNTGGNIIYLSAGSRLTWGSGWAATVSAGVPIVEDLNGEQSEPQARVLVGVSKAF